MATSRRRPIRKIDLDIESEKETVFYFANAYVTVGKNVKANFCDGLEPRWTITQPIGRNLIDIDANIFNSDMWGFLYHLCVEREEFDENRFYDLVNAIGYLLHIGAERSDVVVIEDAYFRWQTRYLLKALCEMRWLRLYYGCLDRLDKRVRLLLIKDKSKIGDIDKIRERFSEMGSPYPPKIIVTTKKPIKISDNQINIKLGDFFNRQMTPTKYFGKRLFSGWNGKDWDEFNNVMIWCVWGYFNGTKRIKKDIKENSIFADRVLQYEED